MLVIHFGINHCGIYLIEHGLRALKVSCTLKHIIYPVSLTAKQMHTGLDDYLCKAEAVIGKAGLIELLYVLTLKDIYVGVFGLTKVELVYGLIRIYGLTVLDHYLGASGSANADLYPARHVKAEIVHYVPLAGTVYLFRTHKGMLLDGGHKGGIHNSLGGIYRAYSRLKALVGSIVGGIPALYLHASIVGLTVKDVVFNNGALCAQPGAVGLGEYLLTCTVGILNEDIHLKAGIVEPGRRSAVNVCKFVMLMSKPSLAELYAEGVFALLKNSCCF
jgi:hypothetical protein